MIIIVPITAGVVAPPPGWITSGWKSCAWTVPDNGEATTAWLGAGEPSGKRTTPERTPVEPGGSAVKTPPVGARVGCTNREKSTASLTAPAATRTTLAAATSAVPGKYVGDSTDPAAM